MLGSSVVEESELTPKDVALYYKTHGLPPNFCAAPFSDLVFEADGHVRMCRRTAYDSSIGNVRTQSLQEIWNGEIIQSIRREFLSGNVRTCAQDIARKRCNLSHASVLPHIEYSAVQSRPPLRITPNFNGQCNLECPMCSTWQAPNHLYDEVGFWPILEREILPNLKSIETFSGEPFLQKDTYRLIELAARINPQIRWSFNTNANWRLSPSIKAHLDKIIVSKIDISLDSLDEKTYVQIRKNGRLGLALETLDAFLAYNAERVAKRLQPIQLGIYCTIQKCNWRDVPALLRFRRSKGIRIGLQCLHNPVELSVIRLEESERMRILDYFLEEIPPPDFPFTTHLISILLEGLSTINRAAQLCRIREKLDQAVALPQCSGARSL